MEERKEEMIVNNYFDLAEKKVREYISEYTQISPPNLYKDHDSCPVNLIFQKPLIFSPIEEYNPNKYLEISLELVPFDFKCGLVEYINIQPVLNIIHYVQNAVFTVFSSLLNNPNILKQSEEFINYSFHLEFDENNFSFYPVYINPIRRQYLMLGKHLERFEDMKVPNHNGITEYNELSEESKEEWKKNRFNLLKILNDLGSKIDILKMNEEESNINLDNLKKPRIGIIVKEMVFEELNEEYKNLIKKANDN